MGVNMQPSILKKILGFILSPIFKLIIKKIEITDPWERSERKVPKEFFGSGNIHDWEWYFEGESKVNVNSVKQICHWLCKCEYVLDKDLFQEEDFWQHPITFETIRKGDCEDQALWAWRKLTEIGIYAELVCGKTVNEGVFRERGHAWVIFHQDEKVFILEATATKMNHMILPFEEAKDRYCPCVSVSGSFKTYMHDGFMRVQQST